MKKKYDVIIIGAGPSGIFSALSLAKKGYCILILEKGLELKDRFCLKKEGRCLYCKPCSVLNGWGGAGAFSDGKLTLTTSFGGFLQDYAGEEKTRELIDRVDQTFLSYGAPQLLFGDDPQSVKNILSLAEASELQFIPAPIRHLGTENCFSILAEMKRSLEVKADVRFRTAIKEIIVEKNIVKGVLTDNGESFYAPYIICGPGREGSPWFYEESKRLGLSISNNPVDMGVRVEVPAGVMEHITSKVYESKIIYYSPSFDDKVRTFCMNPYGEVVVENSEGVVTVNGHSYREKERQTENTNFALLVSKNFTEPFNEPVRYGRYIASLANMLGGGVIVQKLGDLLDGRRSTPERIERGLVRPTLKESTPGDLSLVLPYRYLKSILEMLKALDKIAPGIYSPHTLLYGVEVKFYSQRLKMSSFLETEIKNLFAVGDGAGITRGLVQASASGLLAAEEVARRICWES
ncbi:MAG: NAD(P)/FAD-dependent oxidoreductase [Bacillota bacterium]|nr:NAD(P)/FAD-dependent oxidoreductase [Bacillota bacterium]